MWQSLLLNGGGSNGLKTRGRMHIPVQWENLCGIWTTRRMNLSPQKPFFMLSNMVGPKGEWKFELRPLVQTLRKLRTIGTMKIFWLKVSKMLSLPLKECFRWYLYWNTNSAFHKFPFIPRFSSEEEMHYGKQEQQCETEKRLFKMLFVEMRGQKIVKIIYCSPICPDLTTDLDKWKNDSPNCPYTAILHNN